MADAGIGEFFAFAATDLVEVGGMADMSATATAAEVAGTATAAGGTAAATGTAGYLSAGATAVSAGTSLYSAMNAPKLSGFQSTPQSSSSQDTEAAAYAQALNLRQRKGAASTILTGPLGVTSPGQTSRATLGT